MLTNDPLTCFQSKTNTLVEGFALSFIHNEIVMDPLTKSELVSSAKPNSGNFIYSCPVVKLRVDSYC